MRCLRLQGLVDVVALPAGFLIVDLHVKRQCEFALGKHRIETVRQRLEDMLSGLLAGRKIAPLAKPQHHVEKAEIRAPIGDGVVLATDSANPNAAKRKMPGPASARAAISTPL